MKKEELKIILDNHKLWIHDHSKGIRATLRDANLSGANLSDANLSGANIDFCSLPISCRGLNFKIDERIAKQLVYHIINLMQRSELETNKIFKINVFDWLKDSHLVSGHCLPILKGVKRK